MNIKFPSFVLFLFLLASCGGGGTNVKLEVSHNFQFAGSAALQAISGGGLMVWGKNSTTGDSFAQSVEGSDSINLNLSNGAWTFYAMAWDGTKDYNGTPMSPGTSYPFGGLHRCGVSQEITLKGEATAVDLSVTNSSCSNTAFKGALTPTFDGSGNVVLPQTTFSFCRGISQLTQGQDVCADTLKDTRQKERKAYIGSFKVKLKNYRNLGGSKSVLGEISSKCIAMEGDIEIPPSPAPAPASSHSSFYGASLKKISGLPAGGPGMPFHIEVEMFPGNSKCDDLALSATGIRGSLTKQLPNGLNSPLAGSQNYFQQINSVSSHLHKVNFQVTNETICTGRVATGLGDHPFAAGEGTRQNPYLICSVPQFHAINSSSGAYLTDTHFRLAADLDFNPYSKGLAGTSLVPSEFACLEEGSNFIPIGFSSASCTPGNPLTFNTPGIFTGSFMGSGYKIKNLRLRAEEEDYISMFAKIGSGSTPATHYGDIYLDNVEISGKTKVGAFAGDVYATNSGEIEFFKIFGKRLDIESRPNSGTSYVGSLFGYFQNAILDKAVVVKSEVRGDKNYVGGIVGSMVTGTFREVSAEVNIEANSSGTVLYVGGIAGETSTSTLQYVKHEGGIYTNATKVGGIIGSAETGTILQNMYSMSFVYTSQGGSSLKIGGLVGYWNSTGAFGPGYSLSLVKSNCSTSCQQGALVGNATNTTSATLYRLNNTNSGENGGTTMTVESTPGTGTIADMRNTTFLSALTDSGTADWKKVNGQYPRFDFENHPCSNGISGTGDGSLSTPYNICHEAQYIALGSAAANSYHQLAGNIRLSNASTTQSDIPNLSATLSGQGFSVIGGFAAALVVNSGHIGTIASTGKIRNIKYYGLDRYSNSGTTITDAHGVLAAANSGLIENVQICAFGSHPYFGSLVVGTNNTSGTIRNIEVSGTLKANFEGFASIAVKNDGTIEDSKSQNSIVCNEGAGCDRVAGLVVENTGNIYRTEMASHAREGMSAPFDPYTSMLVDTNSGLIQDVFVNDYTVFEVTNGGYYFTRVNSGDLVRVFNSGKLLFPSNAYGSVTSSFPSQSSAVDDGTGTFTDVFRTGAKSGQELLYDVPYTCSTADVMTISAWSGMSTYSTWNTNFTSGYVTDGRKLFAHIKDSNGVRSVRRVHTYNGSNNFGMESTTCAAATSGKVSLYYTNDVAIDLAGYPEAGVKTPQDSIYGNFSTDWQNVMWNQSNGTHRSEILAYYAYLLGLSNPTPPPVPRTWVLDEGQVELFNNH